ncbi:hypothetical protein IAI51_25555 [Pseudomonas sp. N40(2020)]|uniref:hypothetical protein n=1 Tax=Pseudomonas sp. N40(2020) TaxID=2767798 RepID=UPI001656B301|nr:hypothetical protein [Pseudomonas sp. N40(2020)]MBC8999897.1 hypothetical protein [Pseudomonas sp. N40(2020)]
MDQFLLERSAKTLEEVVSQYLLDDAEVESLSYTLSKLIADARAGKIVSPVEWGDVPGAYSFTEGGLRKYSDLEKAYAEFKIEVSGGESPFLRSLRSESGGKGD